MKISNKENINIENKQIKVLQNFIKTWTKKLHYCIKQDDQQKNRYIVEFSKVNQFKPIPNISLKVFFLMKENSEGLEDLQFRFQDEELIHTLQSSIKFQDIEGYIEKQFDNIEKVRQMYFLATHFERTRIIDSRIEQLQEVVEIIQRKKEVLSINNQEFLKKEKRIQLKNENLIQERNFKLFKQNYLNLLRLLDKNLIGYKNLKELQIFLELIGVDIENFSDLNYYLYGDQQIANGVINLNQFQNKFITIVLAKVIFQKSLKRFRVKTEQYYQESQRLFFYKYKVIMSKFKEFMNILDSQQQLSYPNLKLNISKIQEKILTQEEYKNILIEIEKINVFNQGTIDKILKLICQSKKENFIKLILEKNYTKFEKQLLKDFDTLNRPLLKEEFLDAFKQNKNLNVPLKQVEILWELLRTNKLVVNHSFDFKKYVTVISYYLKHLILLTPIIQENELFNTSYIEDLDNNVNNHQQQELSTVQMQNLQNGVDDYKEYLYMNEELENWLKQKKEKIFQNEKLKMIIRIKQINDIFKNLIKDYIIVNQFQIIINQNEEKSLSISDTLEFRNYQKVLIFLKDRSIFSTLPFTRYYFNILIDVSFFYLSITYS